MRKLIVLIIIGWGSITLAAGKPYGKAGCGLGSIVMGADGNQILAATTNDASATNLFGITSGTSNCVEGSDSGGGESEPAPAETTTEEEARLNYFIEINRNNLASDISRGQGETIDHLAGILGCENNSLGSTLKKNYRSIFKHDNQSAGEIKTSIMEVLGVKKVTKSSCSNLG